MPQISPISWIMLSLLMLSLMNIIEIEANLTESGNNINNNTNNIDINWIW